MSRCDLFFTGTVYACQIISLISFTKEKRSQLVTFSHQFYLNCQPDIIVQCYHVLFVEDRLRSELAAKIYFYQINSFVSRVNGCKTQR